MNGARTARRTCEGRFAPAGAAMTVRIFREFPAEELGDDRLARAVEAALLHGGRPGLAVDLVLLSDPALAELHGRFLDDPTPTDVMAFDLGPPEFAPDPSGEREPEAEIYVSVERARALAAEHGHGADRELLLYAIHGALHLCGYDDHEEGERLRMRAAEAAVMQGLDPR